MGMKGYTQTGFAQKVYHLHVRHKGDWPELYFRDYPVQNADVAAEYAALKRICKKGLHTTETPIQTPKVHVLPGIPARLWCNTVGGTPPGNNLRGRVRKDMAKWLPPTRKAYGWAVHSGVERAVAAPNSKGGLAMRRPEVIHINTVIDCAVKDAAKMAVFYAKLLGWQYSHPAANGWAAVTSPGGAVFAFQEQEAYKPPVWPPQKGAPGQMIHMDFWVADEDLEAMVAYAQSLGAVLAPAQYFKSSRTMLDPAGHPFCIHTARQEA